MKIQGKHVVAGVLLLFSAGLAFDSVSNYINPYLSVTQVALNFNRYSGKSIQVMGIVEPGSFIRGDGGTIKFTLTDGQESLPVQFTGPTTTGEVPVQVRRRESTAAEQPHIPGSDSIGRLGIGLPGCNDVLEKRLIYTPGCKEVLCPPSSSAKSPSISAP
jgi:hypothetical protein